MDGFEEKLYSYQEDFPATYVSLIPKLVEHFALLNKWNSVSGLVSPGSLATAASKHYYDSLRIAYYCRKFAQGGLVVDLGSGGGFPGFITSMVHDGRVRAYERIQKKRAFLDFCRGHFQQENFESSGELKKPLSEKTVLSARAVSPLPELLEFLSRVLRQDSLVVVPSVSESLGQHDKFKKIDSILYVLPDGGGPRAITTYRFVPRETQSR